MTGTEKIIQLMREQGSLNNGKGIRLGTMLASNKCQLGNLVLDSDDLMVDSNLKGKLSKGDDVLIYQIDEDFYIISKVVSI